MLQVTPSNLTDVHSLIYCHTVSNFWCKGFPRDVFTVGSTAADWNFRLVYLCRCQDILSQLQYKLMMFSLQCDSNKLIVAHFLQCLKQKLTKPYFCFYCNITTTCTNNDTSYARNVTMIHTVLWHDDDIITRVYGITAVQTDWTQGWAASLAVTPCFRLCAGTSR